MPATTYAARRLTLAHREAQIRLRSATLADLLKVWPLLDPRSLDSTFPGYEVAVKALVSSRRADSSALSAAYFQAFRTAEGVDGTAETVMADPANADALTVSLRVTGPVAVKRSIGNGLDLSSAVDNAFILQAGAVGRYVMDGGRDTLRGSMRADSKCYGWQRIGGGKTCSFCEMLIGRGAVYKSEDSGGFLSHDHCACTDEPVYSTG